MINKSMRKFINIVENYQLPSIHNIDVNEFIASYKETILWSETDDDGEPLDKKYGFEDFSKEALDRINADCRAFLHAAGPWLALENSYISPTKGSSISALAGHDFWLTRAGHGAGFWDGDWNDSVSQSLTDKSHSMGNLDIYVGDDNKLYFG